MNKLPFEQRKYKSLTKRKTITNKKFGHKPEERTTEELIHSGILNLNKQSGPTSQQTVAHVKKILNAERAGHSGTLE